MVLTAFLIGFGAGQFVIGPLSDSFDRRAVLLGGMILHAIASVLAMAAPSFETLLLARALEGLCTSATRVIVTSIVRDCYAGRRMASVVSLAMMALIAVPVVVEHQDREDAARAWPSTTSWIENAFRSDAGSVSGNRSKLQIRVTRP